VARILIADDSITARCLFKRTLVNSHHEVVAEVENGEKAVSEYLKFTPDVVAMDLDMPGIGGLEASRRIVSSHPDANIILVTAHEQNDLEIISRQYGFKYVINKPVNQEAVLSVLKRIENEIGSKETVKSSGQVLEKAYEKIASKIIETPESINLSPESVEESSQNINETPSSINGPLTMGEEDIDACFGAEGEQDSELHKEQMVELCHYSRLSYFKGIINAVGKNFLEIKVEPDVGISNFFENDPIVISYNKNSSYSACGYKIISMDSKSRSIKVGYIYSRDILQNSPTDIYPVSLSVDGKVNLSGLKFSALISGLSINNMLISSKTEFKIGDELEFYTPLFDNVLNIRSEIMEKYKSGSIFEYKISIDNGVGNTKKTIKWFLNALNEQHIKGITEIIN